MQSLVKFGGHVFVLISVCVTALCEIIVDDVAATVDDLYVRRRAIRTSREWWVYALFGVGAILSFLVFIQALSKIWVYLKYNRKLQKDGLQKPLTLQPRKPTTAVKSPAAPGVITHYLKKSPSPTALSPTDRSSSGHTPSPSSGKEMTSPKDGLISDGTNSSAGLSATEDNNAGNKPLSEAESTASNGQLAKVGNNVKTKMITNEDILSGSLGQLFFSVRYKKEKNVLLITVLKCQNLPSKDMGMNNDPYVKLQLLPEKQHKVKTRVLRKTRNPVYDEDFSFYGIKYHQLQTITLHFIVLTFDRYSRDEVIGEVFFPLAPVDLSEENSNITFQENIQPRKVKEQGRGEILVSLCWQPAANRLTVVVLKARNLPKMDVTGLADPYVKIYLMYKGQRIAKKKTHVKKRTLNPVFNESFVFEIPATPDGLDSISLEFMLLDWDRVTKNEVIGRLDMGKQCEYQSTAWQHWSQVCNCPRRQIADWHKLLG